MNNPLEEPNTLEEIINDICEEELCKVHISKAEALAQIERDWVKKSEVLEAIGQQEEHKSRIRSPTRSSCKYYNHMLEVDCDCGIIERNEFRTEFIHKTKLGEVNE